MQQRQLREDRVFAEIGVHSRRVGISGAAVPVPAAVAGGVADPVSFEAAPTQHAEQQAFELVELFSHRGQAGQPYSDITEG